VKKKLKSPDELSFDLETSLNSDVSNLEIDYVSLNQANGLELEKLKGRKQDRKERKKYALHIFRFIWIWCGGILLIMVAIGLGYLKFDNSVIITLITTTTANILALFVIVANYLFFRPKK